MLQRLFIKNVALIESLDVELCPGFNVLTGETGAGKSIVIDAVNLALGERGSRELIGRYGERSRVEAVFSDCQSAAAAALLDELEIERDDDIAISRELTASGKSVCRINGVMVTLSNLKRLSDALVDVHGQHEHQSLLSPSSHMGFLDSFDPDAVEPLKSRVAGIAHEYGALQKERMAGFMSDGERERRIDVLKFQIKEIADAKLERNEEEALEAERSLLMNSEHIMNALESCFTLLWGDEENERGALEQVNDACSAMKNIGSFSQAYASLGEKLGDSYYALEDSGFAVRDLKNSFEFDPQRLDVIERRLETISGLKRKYGAGGVDMILAFRDSASSELEALEGAAERRSELDRLMRGLETQYGDAARELSDARRSIARRLETRVLSELCELGLEKTRFSVSFGERTEGALSPSGTERIEFLLSANPGEPLKPLSKVVSGGELSRIMLAFKAIFADSDAIETLIFDEIDTGISGATAEKVGEKLSSIAMERQVICITHLPQIAALADAHYLVEKDDDGQTTRTSVRLLDADEQLRRLARMMGGESPAALEHARSLVAAGRERKK